MRSRVNDTNTRVAGLRRRARSLFLPALALLVAACGDDPTPASSDGSDLLGGSQGVLVLEEEAPPSGDYQQSCSGCAYGVAFGFSDEPQTGQISALYCSSCSVGSDGPSGPALFMSVPDDAELSYCETSNGQGALVDCDCSDADCIAASTTPPSDLVAGGTTYQNSCSGCNMLVAPTSGNGLLACSACLDNKMHAKLTAVTLSKSSPANSVANCDGQLIAKQNCPPKNIKSDLEKYLEKVWKDVKKVMIYIIENPPPTSTGTNSEDYFQLMAEGEEDTTADSIVDAALTLLDGLSL